MPDQDSKKIHCSDILFVMVLCEIGFLIGKALAAGYCAGDCGEILMKNLHYLAIGIVLFLTLGASAWQNFQAGTLWPSAEVEQPLQGSMTLAKAKIPIIDAHIHTDFDQKPDESSGIMNSLEQMQKEFSEAGVVGAVSHSDNGADPGMDLRAQQIIHCYGIAEDYRLEDLRQGLRSRRFGCIKIYLGYVHHYASSALYLPIYRLAEEEKVPVVFHTGDTYSSKGKLKYADPLTIDEVAVDFPNVTFVIAHLGNPWVESAAEVAYKNPNVYIEASALMIGNLSQVSARKLNQYVIGPIRWAYGYMENPDKIMFGTDWPLVDIQSYIRAYQAAIPREHWQKVFYDNARKVFSFP